MHDVNRLSQPDMTGPIGRLGADVSSPQVAPDLARTRDPAELLSEPDKPEMLPAPPASADTAGRYVVSASVELPAELPAESPAPQPPREAADAEPVVTASGAELPAADITHEIADQSAPHTPAAAEAPTPMDRYRQLGWEPEMIGTPGQVHPETQRYFDEEGGFEPPLTREAFEEFTGREAPDVLLVRQYEQDPEILPEAGTPSHMLGNKLDEVFTAEAWGRGDRLDAAPDIAEAANDRVAVADHFPTPEELEGWDKRQLDHIVNTAGDPNVDIMAYPYPNTGGTYPGPHDSTMFVDYTAGETATLGYIPRGSRRVIFSQPTQTPNRRWRP
jgi:hypothetical protein